MQEPEETEDVHLAGRLHSNREQVRLRSRRSAFSVTE
jgi:hypothetical protein